jgi:hypothetical protein
LKFISCENFDNRLESFHVSLLSLPAIHPSSKYELIDKDVAPTDKGIVVVYLTITFFPLLELLRQERCMYVNEFWRIIILKVSTEKNIKVDLNGPSE